jgi:TM2 domain-containing membrane protein YozV
MLIVEENMDVGYKPVKEKSTAFILEILLGLFGISGIGWIYAGQTGTGVAFLIGMLVWMVIAGVVGVLTVGVGCVCTVPINLVIVGVSTMMLNQHMQRNPDQFR